MSATTAINEATMGSAPGQGQVWAVVPMYQAAATAAQVIRGIRQQGVSVLAVDDGSSDGSAAVARAAGARVLRHPRNRGKGSALVTGFHWALAQGASRVLTLDADLQHDPAEIPQLLRLGGDADLVIGARSFARADMPRSRFVGNSISSYFVGRFCGRKMADTQCGYRCYSRRLLTRLPLGGGRFETETELLMRAELLGLTVSWVPIATIYDGVDHKTHFRNVADTLRVIRVVLASPRYPRAR